MIPSILLLLVIAGIGAWIFYETVLRMRRLDPGHNVPLQKRLRTWTKEMFCFIFSLP